jgi:acyl-CoA thioesterase
MTTMFDKTTALAFEDDRHAVAELDPSWSSLRGVHGGYLTAIAVRAAEAHLQRQAVRTVTTSFLRPAAVGPLQVSVSDVRRGRNVTVQHVDLAQDGRSVANVRVTSTAPTSGTRWSTAPNLVLPPRQMCEPVQPPPGVRHFEQAEAVLDPADRPFAHGPRARIAGYVRPLDARPVDAPWLAMILDWLPPATFAREDPPNGGVSIDYTVHLHRTSYDLPGDDWLAAELRADISHDGLALEQGMVVDPAGHVLAQSFHTRWTG